MRIKKEAAEEAKKVFGDVEIISLGQLPQERAFITDEMTQEHLKRNWLRSEIRYLQRFELKIDKLTDFVYHIVCLIKWTLIQYFR